MCRPGPDFTCEHLPTHFVKTAKIFRIVNENGKHWVTEEGKKCFDTLKIRLCKDCAKAFIREAELTEKDKNQYGAYTPGTTQMYY